MTCLLLIIFANSLDPDQDRQNVGPDLDPNHLTLILILTHCGFCLFVCFDSLRPINNLSVIKGRVFLG